MLFVSICAFFYVKPYASCARGPLRTVKLHASRYIIFEVAQHSFAVDSMRSHESSSFWRLLLIYCWNQRFLKPRKDFRWTKCAIEIYWMVDTAKVPDFFCDPNIFRTMPSFWRTMHFQWKMRPEKATTSRSITHQGMHWDRCCSCRHKPLRKATF